MDVFIRSAVLEAIHGVQDGNHLQDEEAEIQMAAKGDTNFLGVVQRVKFGGRLLIVKTQPTNQRRRELFNASLLFSNEAYFYTKVRPLLGSMPKYLLVPRALVAREDVLVLDDLCPRGFVTYDKDNACDLAHTELILRAMAGLHASSMILKRNHPEVACGLREVLFLRPGTPEYWQRYYNACANTVKLMQEEFPQGGKYLDKCQEMLKDAYHLFTSTTDPEDKHAIFIHGDLWLNNILFKYIEKEPVEVAFLDYQIARVASPITDFVYFLYICTEGELRKAHYQRLVQVYFETFTERLRLLGVDPQQVFPQQVFKDHLKRYSRYGFACAMIMVPILFGGETALAAFEDPNKEDEKKIETPAKVRQRIKDILIELVDLGYAD